MGYLAEGKVQAFFVRLNDYDIKEVNRLHSIGKRTNKNRVKKKIAKRIDSLVEVKS